MTETTNPRTEAVAKAIAKRRGYKPHVLNAKGDPMWTSFIEDAQAAEKALIEALMEPSDEMLQAGYRAVWGSAFGNKAVRNGQTHRIFKAMLKAAGEGQ